MFVFYTIVYNWTVCVEKRTEHYISYRNKAGAMEEGKRKNVRAFLQSSEFLYPISKCEEVKIPDSSGAEMALCDSPLHGNVCLIGRFR